MKLTFIYLFIPLFLLLLSCQKSNKEISNVQEIDCSFDKSMTIKMSEIIDSIEIVPLETRKSLLSVWPVKSKPITGNITSGRVCHR